MNVLVIGGAGYIGSHCVRQLHHLGHNPIVLDNLIFGHQESLSEKTKLYRGKLGNQELVRDILRKENIDIVMHFAAFCFVSESVENPLKYYKNNVIETLLLLETMIEEEVTAFIFSSTAAVYGIPERLPIQENTPLHPINPYGQTKLDIENALKIFAKAYGLSSASFRYFNAAGASEDASIGEDHDPETHLIPIAIQSVLKRSHPVKIFGTNYNTPDGTCLRDYIHVDDLVRAHILAMEKLTQPGTVLTYNLGTGMPYSVRDVIHTVEKVSKRTVPVEEIGRRPGDPPILCADSSKAQKELNWTIQFKTLESIIQTAWNWHRKHPNGYIQED